MSAEQPPHKWDGKMIARQISELCQAIRTLAGRHTEQEQGASIIEYALLITFIAVVAFVAVGVLGQQTASAISGVTSAL